MLNIFHKYSIIYVIVFQAIFSKNVLCFSLNFLYNNIDQFHIDQYVFHITMAKSLKVKSLNNP